MTDEEVLCSVTMANFSKWIPAEELIWSEVV
jgi:hypothetical protein